MKNVNTKYGKQPKAMMPLLAKITEVENKLIGQFDAKVGRSLTQTDASNLIAEVLMEVVQGDPKTPIKELIAHLDYIFNDALFNQIKKNTEKNLAILN